jgi:hypothetical protein
MQLTKIIKKLNHDTYLPTCYNWETWSLTLCIINKKPNLVIIDITFIEYIQINK